MRRITILGIAGGLFLLSCSSQDTPKHKARIEVVQRDDLEVEVTAAGTVEPERKVEVKSLFSGKVKQLFVSEADRVTKGQKLALIEQEPKQASQIAQSKATVREAKLNLEDAKRNLEQQQELYQKGFVAEDALRTAIKNHESKEIQYELAVRQLWANLGGTGEAPDANSPEQVDALLGQNQEISLITAPASGVVAQLNVEVGEMVISGTSGLQGGSSLFTIADLSSMLIKADINEVDIGDLRIGQPARIQLDAVRDKTYQGKVTRLSPWGTAEGSSSSSVVTYSVEILVVDSDERLKPGMTADVDIITVRKDEVLYLPLSVINREGGEAEVALLRDGKPVRQKVITGIRNDNYIEIVSGLAEGDTVQAGSPGMLPSATAERRGPPGGAIMPGAGPRSGGRAGH